MKKFLKLAIVPFWYFALVTNHHLATQFGPFATQQACEQMATAMTVLVPPSGYELVPGEFVARSTHSDCWSDS